MIPKRIAVLGNFDGVHLAHRALLDTANEIKKSRDAGETSVTVWTFRDLPPCKSAGKDDARYGVITAPEMRKAYLEAYGADEVIFSDFVSVRDFSPEKFVTDILLGELSADIFVCGFNYHFGQGGKADARELSRLAACHCAQCITVPEISDGDLPISSTRIRNLIISGDITESNRILGHPFVFYSDVIHGRHFGTSLGFSTANQSLLSGMVCPANGVYATFVCIDGKCYPSVTNVGVCPTVTDGASVSVETHIIGYSGDLYGKYLPVGFLSRIRDEKHFDDKSSLRHAIEHDTETSKTVFGQNTASVRVTSDVCSKLQNQVRKHGT